MNLIRLYDYVLYRLCIVYLDGKEPPISYASGLVALIQFASVFSVETVFRIFFDYNVEKYIYISVFLIFIALNMYRYEWNFDFMKLHSKWKNEDKLQRKIRGYLIVIYMTAVILFPIIFGLYMPK
jgi:hypothetical protein